MLLCSLKYILTPYIHIISILNGLNKSNAPQSYLGTIDVAPHEDIHISRT
jgi:hypothetical protein